MLLDLVIVALLAGVGYVGYRAWRKSQATAGTNTTATKTPSVSDARMTDVRPGAVVHLRHIGVDMRETDVEITARHTYKQGHYQWWELEGETGDGTVWLDVEEDDELEVSLSLERLALEDVGLTAAALDDMATNGKGELTHGDERWRLLEANQATFCRNGDDARAEPLQYWDFEAEQGEYDLAVERWDNGDHSVYRMQTLKPSQIKIYSLGEGR